MTLGALTAGLLISPEVVEIGFRLGVLRAWIAVSGANTVERIPILQSSTTARTTIVADANGEFVSATPIDVQAALPDTQWTTGPGFPTFTQPRAAASGRSRSVRATRRSRRRAACSSWPASARSRPAPG